MVSCRQCNTHNSLDSAFCKHCGATLSPEDIEIATEKLAMMIADGNKLFADGRTEDAMMVAETAVATNPTSASAISLKGMCYERRGQIAEALECFEKGVELNPSSALDKIKVNDLRNMLVAEKFEVREKPNRRIAVVGALAAVVLVSAVGALVAKANAPKAELDKSKLLASNEPAPELRTFGEIMPKTGTQAPSTDGGATQNQPNAEPGTNNVDGNGPPSSGAGRREDIRLPNYSGGRIPRPEEGVGGTFQNTEVRPLDPGVRGPIGGGNTGNGEGNGGKSTTDPDPTELKNNNVGEDPKTEPKNDPGIIEIDVVGKNGSKSGGNAASPANSGNGRQALIASARSMFQQGNYTGAANSYERALRMGADSASTNQRLGQCYAHLGRTGDAIAAYTRAANAFEQSGNAQARDACLQAITVLGGG
ncbi:MAG: tetratricopeptide repeat protein [Fimbriimonadaceae bacterium]|nr:tetratricopeptide repeat protein [Fimbriimonadaceae bacterium]